MAGIKNSLQLRQAQTVSLAMTPQLQQAIKLLQLSTIELQQEIQQIVEQNPLLEMDEKLDNPNLESLETLAEKEITRDQSSEFDPFDNDCSVKSLDIDGFDSQKDITVDSPSISKQKADSELHDQYSAGLRQGKSYSIDSDSVYEGETSETLQDHLFWQLDLSPLTGADKLIAEIIIDSINDSGYLTEPLSSILETVKPEYPTVTEEDISTVLKLIQHYDPIAVGSRNVQECLSIQLDALDENTEYLDLAKSIVKNHLNLLSNRDYRTLCQRLSVKEKELKAAVDLITKLNPRPGHFAIHEKSDYIIPDIKVIKTEDGDFDVELNPFSVPNVRLNNHYKNLANSATNERDKNFFKSNLQEANWFIQSLAKRNDTLLKVAKCIVSHQKEFMLYGESAMHPMVLNDVATEVSMHESTVSRVTTEKYIHTPRGTYELKYFFSSSVSTESGDAASSKAIRARIKELISKENPRKPYSDSLLADMLNKEGIVVARRTIAKYRESIGIASSSQRKRLV